MRMPFPLLRPQALWELGRVVEVAQAAVDVAAAAVAVVAVAEGSFK